ncbi:helix-turn-helix transcriptional regulator [Luteolibacter flavescens]|uniref:Helix-turn-helix transcriptional regulator n=1 Tax=Luteolibacter flavescens TaxID=1859460 RepID=A0ABT3FVD1_9BACT|nr:helix-turn-helix transcriptional regulator [Luteolibacter flavescens]MCW1887540.1 helix-turn-helix transcriptional regulator [Luteolibacter flavescens]
MAHPSRHRTLPLIVKPIWGHALRASRQVPHRHPYYELFILRGRGTFLSDGQAHHFDGHTGIFIAPGKVHGWELDVSTQGCLIAFGGEMLQSNPHAGDLSSLPFFSFLTSRPLLDIPGCQGEDFDAMRDTIFQEFQGDGEWSSAMLVQMIQLLLVRSARMFPAMFDEQASAPARITQKFLSILAGACPAGRRVQDYAAELELTPHRLIECVKCLTGRTPGELIDDRTMQEANRLLEYTGMTMAEIAYELEFKDPSHFGHFFKRHAGCTPGEARKRLHSQPAAERCMSLAG